MPQTITSTGHGYITGYQVHVNTLSTFENKGVWAITVIDVNTFQLTTFVAGSGTGNPAAVGDQIFADLQTSQCNFSPVTVTPYMLNQYKQAALILAAVGVTPWLQFGEILWWFFASTNPATDTSTMAYYDEYTATQATTWLDRAMVTFRSPNDDPSVNNYADANVLRGMLQTHLQTIRAAVQAIVPNARFEILWPDDVNWPTSFPGTPTDPFPIGGQLNRYVNTPETLLQIGGVVDRWKTEALAWGSNYLVLENAIAAIRLAAKYTNWPKNQSRYLVPWDTSYALWRNELPQALAWLMSANLNVNFWAIDHAILFSWDTQTVVDSFLGGGNSGQ